VVVEKSELIFFYPNLDFQPIFDTKHHRNYDKLINGLKKSKNHPKNKK
jgi:hypothetical protein